MDQLHHYERLPIDLAYLVHGSDVRMGDRRRRSCLADQSIYADASRKGELRQLVQDQAAARAAIESLEWEWLEASEELEQAT